jgi:hypothetical protein
VACGLALVANPRTQALPVAWFALVLAFPTPQAAQLALPAPQVHATRRAPQQRPV